MKVCKTLVHCLDMALDQGVARRPEETEKSLGIKVTFWGITFVKGWISPKFPKAVQD